jgi:ubiquinone/menaquinone biosynthesis C-methylase UbiE
MEEYQTRFVANVQSIIANNWLLKRPNISILDMGCEPTGKQLVEISKLSKGITTGINVSSGFPPDKTVAILPPQVRMIAMDGMDLKFPSNSFDLVISANVIEHVPNPDKFILEAARVLKPSGIAYIETAPVWTSARGHHVMEGMIRENCPEETSYRDDGTVIPDWAHLTYTREQMQNQLSRKLNPATIDYILWYIYDSGDLNKWPWRQIKSAIERSFPHVRIAPHELNDVRLEFCPQNQFDDYSVYGFRATCRKKPVSALTRRLYWRLRKIGL